MPVEICRWMRERKRQWRWRPFPIADTTGSLFIWAKNCLGKRSSLRIAPRLTGLRRFNLCARFSAALPRAAHAVAIAAGAVVAPAARVGFGSIVEYPLTSFIRTILQAIRTIQREHFHE